MLRHGEYNGQYKVQFDFQILASRNISSVYEGLRFTTLSNLFISYKARFFFTYVGGFGRLILCGRISCLVKDGI